MPHTDQLRALVRWFTERRVSGQRQRLQMPGLVAEHQLLNGPRQVGAGQQALARRHPAGDVPLLVAGMRQREVVVVPLMHR